MLISTLVDRCVDVCVFSVSFVTAAPLVVQIEDVSLQKSSAVVDNEKPVPIATIVYESCDDTPSDTGLPDESVVEDPSIHNTSGSTCQTTDTDKVYSGVLDSGLLDTTKVVHILTNTSGEGLGKILGGVKENCFYVLNNSQNLEKRSRSKKRSCFSDYCGDRDSESGTSPKSYYLLKDNGDLAIIYKRKNPELQQGSVI